jgi:hypothetical protein
MLYSVLTILFFTGAMFGVLFSFGAILKCTYENYNARYGPKEDSKPVVSKTRKFFKRYVVKASTGQSSVGECPEAGCSICLAGLSPGDTVIEVTCGHMFHESCVGPWFCSQSSCPMCRADLNELCKKKEAEKRSRRTKSFGDIPLASTQLTDIEKASSSSSLKFIPIEAGADAC